MESGTFLRKYRKQINIWYIVTVLGAAVILLPIIYILMGFFSPVSENWAHIKEYILADYVMGSLKMVISVGILATSIGVVFAWLVAAYSFPMRNFFRWALILPLAVPPYIAAYTYSTMTSYTGVIQSFFRNHLDYQFVPGTIEIKSTSGAIFILTLFLYPYVYMITLSFLEKQSTSYIENAKLLGLNGIQLFTRVTIPIARPAIIAGAMLVIFEVLSDFGVTSYFGVQTVSTAIFQTWFGMYDIDSAMRLAAWLLVIIVGVFVFERFLRRQRKYHATTSNNKPLKQKRLKGLAARATSASCTLLFLIAFLVPFIQIIYWTTITYQSVWRTDFIVLMKNSVTGAFLGSLIIIIFTLFATRTIHVYPSSFTNILSRVMTAGYAVPGAVIAIGILSVFIALDKKLSSFYVLFLNQSEGAMILSLSLAMLIIGYVIRFIAPSFNAVDAGYEKIPPTYREASSMLGRGAIYTFFKVELPLLKSSIFIGFVLSFLEIMKELPLTLLLRPFNFDTLATRTYQYASDERIYEAALPSLMLIGLSLLSVFIILRIEERGKS